jgi:beta-galactosidase
MEFVPPRWLRWPATVPHPGLGFTEDTWAFGWLDDVMNLLYDNGIAVDLATATASPPPWLTAKHPEILPVTARGETVWPGARQHWRPTSPVFRRYALDLVRTMANRYADHPALAAWHVSNELGCHKTSTTTPTTPPARSGPGYAGATKASTGSTRRGHVVLVPALQRLGTGPAAPAGRVAPQPHPAARLQALLLRRAQGASAAERDLLRTITPDVPVTTNFMVMGEMNAMNYPDWAAEVDFVANDHYLTPGPPGLTELLFSANLTGSLAPGRPWFLMEHATSAVNWRSVNVAKRDGELLRDSLARVAHGADAVCFFQWRQSAAGAEKYHSAMLPMPASTATCSDASSTRRRQARVAILFDWTSWWASEQDSHPSSHLRYRQEAIDWYEALQRAGVRADVVPASTPLDGYAVVVAPILHVVPSALADRLTRYVEHGGHLVTTYFSGIVDDDDHIILGGYPGALRELLGLRIEEFGPLPDGETVALDDGGTGSLWTDRIDVVDDDVQVLAHYANGEHTGRAAITRRTAGRGSATYVSTRLGPEGLRPVLDTVLAASGVHSELPPSARGRVEDTIREDDDAEFRFLINVTDEAVAIGDVDGDLLIPRASAGPPMIGPRGVAVIRRARGSSG